jgi:hypothetical protein
MTYRRPAEPVYDERSREVNADPFPERAYQFQTEVIRTEVYDEQKGQMVPAEPRALEIAIKTEVLHDPAFMAKVQAARDQYAEDNRQRFHDIGKGLPEAVALVEAKAKLKTAEDAQAHAQAALADLDSKLADVETAEADLEKLLVKRAKTQATVDALAIRVPALRDRVDELTVDFRTTYWSKKRAFLADLRRQCRDRLNNALVDLRTAMVKSPQFAAVLAAEEPRMLFWHLDHTPTPEAESLVTP